MSGLVRVTRFKLNAELTEWLQTHPTLVIQTKRRQNAVVYRTTKWRLRDRLTEVDIIRLIMAYKTGIATSELAARFSINVKSARKLLRQYGQPLSN